MAAKKLPLTKALYTAMCGHVQDPIKHPRAKIMKKFELKQPNNFYRKFYFAMMQEAREMQDRVDSL